jgi:group I intron endonuclease
MVIFMINTLMSVNKGKIYKITNKVNQKVYVGCTVNTLEQRFYEHMYRCFKTDYKSKLYNSIKKYGEENFEISLIEECNLDCIYETEKKYIEEYNSYEDGLNSTYGGEGCLGYTHSPEIRKKISEGTKNGNSHKGKTYEELYGERAEEEKMKRKNSVKNGWKNLTEEDKKNRIYKAKEERKKNSKYSIELIKEVKDKILSGLKIKEVKILYPQISESYLYSLKTNRRRTDL